MAATRCTFLGTQFRRNLLYIVSVVSAIFILYRLFAADDDRLPPDVFEDSPEHALCAAHGFSTFPAAGAGSHRKVYDLTMINTELDWLEVRLETLYNDADLFIIVESPINFHGHIKPMHLKDNWGRFAKYHDKMVYHVLEFSGSFTPRITWEIEQLQRDASYEQALLKLSNDRAPRLGDVLIVADVDEIPRPETIQTLRACNFPRRLTLFSRFYYYSFQFQGIGPEWHHPQATYYDGQKTIKPNDLRAGKGGNYYSRKHESGRYDNSSWHCSSCFDSVEQFLNKMASFSHSWMNGPEYRDPDHIVNAVRDGQDIWGRKSVTFERLENNQDLPPLVREDERFLYLKDRSGESAGMKDYP